MDLVAYPQQFPPSVRVIIDDWLKSGYISRKSVSIDQTPNLDGLFMVQFTWKCRMITESNLFSDNFLADWFFKDKAGNTVCEEPYNFIITRPFVIITDHTDRNDHDKNKDESLKYFLIRFEEDIRFLYEYNKREIEEYVGGATEW